ncbi:NADPH oxidase 4 [Culex quinquefasciatus]|uniref:NADPH oxidase 4 n=1 Tax=Culex quinquefasciatus TaxID=7176 RepID=UPI0018E3C48E|nr:NADPH oxidase 4 [Culex quinquefasciatus]XP_038121733.1 NADPH oxidase 4 [Culex quinquefasciatus]
MESTGKVYHATRNFMFKYFLAFVWIGFNFVVFCKAFSNYHHEPEFYYLSKILGNGLCVSRGTAPVLNLTMALITLPMCRSLNVALNGAFGRWSVRVLVFYLEKIKVLHLALGVGLIIVGVIHSIAHFVNIHNFIENYDEKYDSINWASGQDDSRLRLLLATPTGFSGCVMLTTLLAIAYFSSRQMRDRFYNSFFAAHHLFLLFYGMMFYHPLSNIIKYQTNLKTHPNGCDMVDEAVLRNDTVLQAICSEEPTFEAGEKIAWIWPLIGLSVYLLDVTCRYLTTHSSSRKVATLQSHVLPGKGIYLRLRFTRTKRVPVGAGQYVLLQCPAISTLEWHPFTVIDFPTTIHNTVSLAISVRGDWTQRLYELVSERERYKHDYGVEICRRRIDFLLDGPYPSAMTSMLKYKRIVYVGAGVGITPFAGFVRHMLNFDAKWPTRIHLIWIVKNAEMFTWFADELTKLQERFWKQNKPDRFTLKLFWTQNFNQNLVEEYFSDYPTLKARIFPGRPKWDDVFLDFVTLYPRKAVTLFSCGPKGLTKELKSLCRRYRKHGCNFSYFHEGFG